ncbi:MAG: glycosyltransferase family 4 protein [Bacteroidota bacterium]
MKRQKLLVVCPFPVNEVPGQRLKYEQYFDSWKEAGFDITVKSFISEKFMRILYQPGNIHLKFLYTLAGYFNRIKLLFSIRKFDLVYSFLWVTPFGPPVFESLLASLSKKLIYDIDDLVFLKHESKANRFISFLKGKSKPIYLMKQADHVITCTPYLDEFVKQYNSNTTDISSTVDTDSRYIPKNEFKNNHQLIIGWSGSHSTSKYLYLLKEVLQDLAKEVDFKLIVMGDKTFQIEGVNIEAFEWKESIEISTLQRFDIGLYPLPFEEWVLGKSGLKAIQYMALGIPTIATEIGTIHRVISHTLNGYLIPENNKLLWKKFILDLMSDETLRKQIGHEARTKIVNEFSIKANKDKYLEIFYRLIKS